MSGAGKGNAVVLERIHFGQQVTSLTFQIAQATEAKDGCVSEVKLPGGEKSAFLGPYRGVATEYAEKQEGAWRLYTMVRAAQNSWPTLDTLRKAVNEAFALSAVTFRMGGMAEEERAMKDWVLPNGFVFKNSPTKAEEQEFYSRNGNGLVAIVRASAVKSEKKLTKAKRPTKKGI